MWLRDFACRAAVPLAGNFLSGFLPATNGIFH